MASTSRSPATRILAVTVQLLLLCPCLPSQQPEYTFHAQTDLVLVNVTVRDRNGNLVRGLKREDFPVLEDNKPQKVVSFDVENTDAVPTQDVTQAKPLPASNSSQPTPSGAALGTADEFRDRRLIVLFFDLSAMQPDEID